MKPLIARKPDCCVTPTACWAKRLFERASFKRGAAMTGKLMVLEGARKEEELVCDYKIVSIVENYNIHTSSLYRCHTVAEKGVVNLEIVGNF